MLQNFYIGGLLMKKYIVALLMMIVCMCGFNSLDAYAESTLIPQVYINTPNGDYDVITKDEYVEGTQITIVDPSTGSVINETQGQVAYRGNSTLNAPKKPYKIKLSEKIDVLGMGKAKKWAFLACAYDKTMIRNKLAFDFATEIGLDYTSESRFVELYLNGKYLGCYVMIEPVETGSTRVDIDVNEDDVDANTSFLIELEMERVEADKTYITTELGKMRFAFDDPDEVSEANIAYVQNQLAAFEELIFTDISGKSAQEIDVLYTQIENIIDVESFINFYIVQELFKNIDLGYSSTRFYLSEGKIYAGPLWDMDLSAGNLNLDMYPYYCNNDCENTYEGLWSTNVLPWYGRLMQYNEFVQSFLIRYEEVLPNIVNIYQNNELGTNKIDSLTEKYKAAFNRNYQPIELGGSGWDVSKEYSKFETKAEATYDENLEVLRNWLKSRNQWILQNICSINNVFSKISNLKITAKDNSTVTLSWGASTNATYYEVYRKEGNGKYSLLNTVTGLTYKDVNLKAGINYSYYVIPSMAFYGEVARGSNSNTINVVLEKPPVVPDKPNNKVELSDVRLTSVKAVNYKTVKVTWRKVAGATGYEIYRSSTKSGTYKKVATVTSGTTLSKNVSTTTGTKYFYKVKAYRTVDGVKVYSKLSNAISCKTKLNKAVLSKATKKSSKSIKLTWKKVSGANGYEIYMKTGSKGSYKKIKTLSAGKTTFTKTKLVKGKKYSFKIKAYRKVGKKKVYSAWSMVKSLKL